MKKVKIGFPENQADAIAQWMFEKGVKILLSYSKEVGFFDTSIIAICAVPDESEAEFKTKFASYIKN